MKIKNSLYLILLVVTTQLFFACSTGKYYDFGSQGAYGKKEVAKAAKQNEELVATDLQATNEQDLVVDASADVTTPAPAAKPLYLANKATKATSASVEQPLTKAERKHIVKELRAELKADANEKKGTENAKKPAVVSTVLLVILAFLLPPLAVYLVRGLSGAFWLNVVLTLLFFIPGVIHALIVVLGNK